MEERRIRDREVRIGRGRTEMGCEGRASRKVIWGSEGKEKREVGGIVKNRERGSREGRSRGRDMRRGKGKEESGMG